jgi:ArsR family transcriptional regulator, arsenate/arsenite/antimonite-responsive transcriptional repressor
MSTQKSSGISIKQIAKTLAKCTPLFQALGEPARQQIILMLAETEELNVSEIAGRMALSRPSISHHLKVLRQADLVTARRDGTENFYKLTMDDALILLSRFVSEVEDCDPEAE